MGWLDWLTGRKHKANPTEVFSRNSSATHRRHSMDEIDSDDNDIISGWQLHVTMSLTTPLEWLLRDGEISKERSDVPQQFAIWVPKTKEWRELGIDVDELQSGTRASQIGQIAKDGGDFLLFLIQYRGIVEANDERRILLSKLLKLGEKYPDINTKLGGDLAQSFVTSELTTLSGCGYSTASRLYQAGFLSKQQVLQSSVEGLTCIKGIGPNLARKILTSEPLQPS